MTEAEADGHFAGLNFFEGAGTGFFHVRAGVGFELFQDSCAFLFAVSVEHGLGQQPGCRRAHDIRQGNLIFIYGVGQVFNGFRHGEIFLLQYFRIDEDGAELACRRLVIRRRFLQGLGVEGQVCEHLVFLLGRIDIIGAHSNQVGFDIRAFGHELTA